MLRKKDRVYGQLKVYIVMSEYVMGSWTLNLGTWTIDGFFIL